MMSLLKKKRQSQFIDVKNENFLKNYMDQEGLQDSNASFDLSAHEDEQVEENKV